MPTPEPSAVRRYRKKPVVVEAAQFFEDSLGPLPFSPDPVTRYDGRRWYVETIHGEKATIVDGDWIIREAGTRDRAYPCKPDIFEATYEPAD